MYVCIIFFLFSSLFAYIYIYIYIYIGYRRRKWTKLFKFHIALIL